LVADEPPEEEPVDEAPEEIEFPGEGGNTLDPPETEDTGETP
jgi:hypothetical protein